MSQAQLAASGPSVSLIDNRPATTSLDIAKFFGKDHGKVIRDIRNLLESCPTDFTEANFGLSAFTDPTGRKLPMFTVFFDGFMLLVMGYTGKKALGMKLAYIGAFNAMREQLERKKPSARQRRPRKALPAPEQLALPTPAKDKFEAYLEEVETFRVRTQQERERLFHTALALVDVYKTGGALSRALFSVISDWLDKTALSPTSIFDSCLTPYAPILIVRELERKLPSMLDFLPGKKR